MNTYKRYMALAATAIICTASLQLGAMKEPELPKTSKISLSMLFLQAVGRQDLRYIQDHIDSMPPEILETALETLQGAQESEVYTFIANYRSTHSSNTEKKRKRDDQPFIDVNPEEEKEIKKRKQDQETLFLEATKKNNIKIIIANYEQMSDETFQKAIKLAPNGTIAKFLSRIITERNQAQKDNANQKDDKDQETLTCPICADEQKELEWCSICLNLSSNENNTEIPFVALRCDKKNKISHDFHISCLSNYAKEYKKNIETMFPCPYCKKNYDVTELLSEEEIKKIEHLITLIHNASTGNIDAAKEIIENHEVTNGDLGIVFKNAAKNKERTIIKLFLNNTDVIKKIGNFTINEVFSTAFSNALNNFNVDIFYEFLCNDSVISPGLLNDILKKIFVAIVKNNLTTFKESFSQIDFKIESNKDIPGLTFFLIGFAGALDIFLECIGKKDSYLLNNTEKNYFRTIFEGAAENGKSNIIKEFFKPDNKTILEQISNDNLEDAFKWAAENGYQNIVQEFFKPDNKTILEKISNDNLGRALIKAANNGHLNIVQEFFKNQNKDILNKISNDNLGRALIKAAKKGHQNIVQEFFKKENEYILNKISNDNLGRALIKAAKKGRLIIVHEFFKPDNKTILEKISNENLGWALIKAAKNDRLIIVHEFFKPDNKTILEKISNENLGPVLKWAANNGHLNIVQEFINNEVVMNKLTQEDLQKAYKAAKTEEIKNEINKAIEEKNKWTCTIQ